MIELLAAGVLLVQTPTLEARLRRYHQCGYYSGKVMEVFGALPVRTSAERRNRDDIVRLAERVNEASQRQGLAIMDQMTDSAIRALDFNAWDARLERNYGGQLDAEGISSLGVEIRRCADHMGVSL